VTVHIVVAQELPASCEEAFDLIHDYRCRLSWDTLLRRAYVEGGGPAARGAVAVCSARWLLGGYSFRTRYVTFDRPQAAAIRLEGRPPFFATWAASIRHVPLPDGRSRATYTMTFTVKPSWARRAIQPVARALFRRETRRRLAALARALDSSDCKPSRADPTVSHSRPPAATADRRRRKARS
jgi:Polyketide cyclase / dehydrase and lipid transport